MKHGKVNICVTQCHTQTEFVITRRMLHLEKKNEVGRVKIAILRSKDHAK